MYVLDKTRFRTVKLTLLDSGELDRVFGIHLPAMGLDLSVIRKYTSLVERERGQLKKGKKRRVKADDGEYIKSSS